LFISAGKTVSDLADQLGFTRNTLSRLINGNASMSIDMALALQSICLHPAEYWLNKQQAYDLYNARLALP